jgi:hypothetical protein
VPPEIHSLVKDADDIDTVCGQAIKQYVRAGRIFMVTSADLGTGPPCTGLRRYILNVPTYLTNVEFSLIDAPMFHCMSPDFIRIAVRAR